MIVKSSSFVHAMDESSKTEMIDDKALEMA